MGGNNGIAFLKSKLGRQILITTPLSDDKKKKKKTINKIKL